ncbi:hypothetical protein ACFYMW_01900 [Streptomyces sp. NPDC006692]|uniref:hypothetical protein n=1 Tax=unclassified Streptomyces TaxID=2593676 RepID=UPI00369571CF
MAAQASVPARSHRHGRPIAHRPSGAVLAIPVVLGVVYGIYAAAIDRAGGPVTGGNIALGVVSGVVIMALGIGLLSIQSSLSRERRAAAYATLFGVGIGFLHSLTGESIIRASGMGLVFGGAMFAASFYWFYTHEN